ncbi:MAG TPA: DUF5985 family protein [Xanthomonadales bacterium]|nr:DUF5985 family protein [Xanthomonadales bacterium]
MTLDLWVYTLCAITASVTATMLLRAWRSTGTAMLFWSGLCFVGLAMSNVVVLVDLLLVPQLDLRWLRSSTGLLAVSLLIYGLLLEDR